MKILITGANGLVGSHFAQTLQKSFHVLTPSYNELDITDNETVNFYFKKNPIDIVVHFAAFTNVSKAEIERDNENGTCWRVNVEGTKNLLKSGFHGHFIFISTDMVFSGSDIDKGPYDERRTPSKNSNEVPWYGWTKKCAEDSVENYKKSTIIRISNPVRKDHPSRPDYIKKIMDKYEKEGSVTLFTDQYLTLTYIPSVTKALQKIIQDSLTGVYHVSSPDLFTPYELGRYVLEKKYSASDKVLQSSLTEYGAKTGQNNRYPQYGGLKCIQTNQKLGIKFPAWREAVDMTI